MNRRVLVVVALGMAVALAGCAAESRTLTQPTPLATKSEDPVTAAKAAFLAYVAASNAVSIDDQASIDAALDATTSPQREVDEEFYRELRDIGWGIEADAKVTVIDIDASHTSSNKLAMNVCVDVTDSLYVNSDGERGQLPDQSPVQPRRVEMQLHGGLWLVAASEPRSGDPKC